MHSIYKNISTLMLSIIFLIETGQQALALHPLAERVIKIINKDGQEALCKKGGIFRETVGLTAGKNCDNKDFSEFAVTACSRSPDFDSSACYNFINKNLGSMGIAAASANLEQSVKLKHNNIYAIVCTTKRENLTGLLKAIADRSCETKPPVPSISSKPSLTIAEKQKIKASIEKDLQTVEAIKMWAYKPSSTRGPVTIGSQRGITIKAPVPSNPSQTEELLDIAQKLSNKLKKLNQVLDSAQPPAVSSEALKKLDDFPKITDTSSINDMTKQLEAMDALLE